MLDLFITPWLQGDWMWRGVLIASLVAVSCGLLGVFLYLRRLSLISDALSHVLLPGIVIAYLLGGVSSHAFVLMVAIMTGLITTFLIGAVSRHQKVKEDAAIGIVFTALFALGIILLNMFARDVHLDAQCVFYGDVLGVSDDSLWIMGGVALLVALSVMLFYKQLLVASFDPVMAVSVGISPVLVHYGLMALLSVTTVSAFEAVGAILVIAMVITPAATAHLLTDRVPAMLALAVAHGLLSALLGMYTSVWFNTSSAGAMVGVGFLLYVLAFLLSPRYGYIAKVRRHRHLAHHTVVT